MAHYLASGSMLLSPFFSLFPFQTPLQNITALPPNQNRPTPEDCFKGRRGVDWDHSHQEINVSVHKTVGFEIYWFKEGTFHRIGDGGYLNRVFFMGTNSQLFDISPPSQDDTSAGISCSMSSGHIKKCRGEPYHIVDESRFGLQAKNAISRTTTTSARYLDSSYELSGEREYEELNAHFSAVAIRVAVQGIKLIVNAIKDKINRDKKVYRAWYRCGAHSGDLIALGRNTSVSTSSSAIRGTTQTLREGGAISFEIYWFKEGTFHRTDQASGLSLIAVKTSRSGQCKIECHRRSQTACVAFIVYSIWEVLHHWHWQDAHPLQEVSDN
ncbi:hypothetical protein BDZ97DRAFT_2063174 [Flammula alnicola]|nr:hypothetical protein BDZ97DRAFT_2063174 [Flammula alnicola]